MMDRKTKTTEELTTIAKKLRKIAYFIRRWKGSVLYFGYNRKGVICLYLRCQDGQSREIPCSWEYVCDHGLKDAWNATKNYFTGENSIAYDCKSDDLIQKGLEL